ncbi:gamma carbonic anhydrase family protein [Myxococcota bacterium]|nr:gamma carbonic anhydrase family protein [Myxococcota bacterium]MBU1429753.1 gamma carbonic anhydrase family protein [Myxococcota bacterium]MBU1900469.1 gamma carbonic anhydrase family protein [Myxococcota bacterium]
MSIQSHKKVKPQLGEAVFVHDSAVVIGRVTLGARSNLWPNTTLRGDEGEIHIGEDTNIQDGTTVHMTGGLSDARIGARVTVGHGCILHGCIVEDDCLIGMGAILLDNCQIGAGSIIGAGTLITQGKIIPPNSMVYGNPFKVVRQTTAQERQYIDRSWRHYVAHAADYLAEIEEG